MFLHTGRVNLSCGHLQLVLSESIASQPEDLGLLAVGSQVFATLLRVLDLALEILNHFTIAPLEKDHLVRDDTHLEEGEGLTLSAREALNNVVCLLLLVLVDFCLLYTSDDADDLL